MKGDWDEGCRSGQDVEEMRHVEHEELIHMLPRELQGPGAVAPTHR